jgi:hypothetical protein
MKAQTDAPTGCYVDGCQYTIEEGNQRVLDIARDFGYSGIDVDESIDWLNSNCRSTDGQAYWGWFESLFGLWESDE